MSKRRETSQFDLHQSVRQARCHGFLTARALKRLSSQRLHSLHRPSFPLTMSSDEAEFISDVFLQLRENYFSIASAAVLAYDIVITNNREVDVIWGRPFSGVTVLFLNMRYVTLLSQIALFATGVEPGFPLLCKATGFIYYLTVIWSNTAFAVFSAVRIWAIWGRHWLPFVIVLFICLMSPAINLALYTHLHIVSAPGPQPWGGCGSFLSVSIDTLTRLSITARASAITADLIILAATWIKTWSIHRVTKSTNIGTGQSTASLSGLLLRDGTVYFATLLCLNITALVLDTTPQVLVNPVSLVRDSFTAILLCRLILNLRSFNADKTSLATINAGQLTSVRFANAILDNIGASISLGEYGDSTDSESYSCDQNKVTWDEIISNPLAIGLKDDVRHTQHDGIDDDFLPV